MAFHVYPYTNFHDLNLDWILEEMKKVSDAIDTWSNEAVEQANAYTDSVNAQTVDKVNADITQFKADVNSANRQYQQNINNVLTQFQTQINQQDKEIEANLASARGYTDTRIAQNNEILMDRISAGIVDVKVLNIFTGKYVTIQEMFDYLAQFHLTGAISVGRIAQLERTVNTVIGYGKTCTELLVDGMNIFEET